MDIEVFSGANGEICPIFFIGLNLLLHGNCVVVIVGCCGEMGKVNAWLRSQLEVSVPILGLYLCGILVSASDYRGSIHEVDLILTYLVGFFVHGFYSFVYFYYFY